MIYRQIRSFVTKVKQLLDFTQGIPVFHSVAAHQHFLNLGLVHVLLFHLANQSQYFIDYLLTQLFLTELSLFAGEDLPGVGFGLLLLFRKRRGWVIGSLVQKLCPVGTGNRLELLNVRFGSYPHSILLILFELLVVVDFQLLLLLQLLPFHGVKSLDGNILVATLVGSVEVIRRHSGVATIVFRQIHYSIFGFFFECFLFDQLINNGILDYPLVGVHLLAPFATTLH